MSERKKPSIGFWATVVVVAVLAVPVLYLVLLGPVLFLNFHHGVIERETYKAATYPLTLWRDHFGNSPEWFWETHHQYLNWWGNVAEAP